MPTYSGMVTRSSVVMHWYIELAPSLMMWAFHRASERWYRVEETDLGIDHPFSARKIGTCPAQTGISGRHYYNKRLLNFQGWWKKQGLLQSLCIFPGKSTTACTAVDLQHPKRLTMKQSKKSLKDSIRWVSFSLRFYSTASGSQGWSIGRYHEIIRGWCTKKSKCWRRKELQSHYRVK